MKSINWLLVIAVPIAVFSLIPYWKAWRLSRTQKANKSFPPSVLIAAGIGFIFGFVLNIIVLKNATAKWEDIFLPIIGILFFLGAMLGLIVAFKTGIKPKIFKTPNPEALALPVEASSVLSALAFIWGTVGGILGSMFLIMSV